MIFITLCVLTQTKSFLWNVIIKFFKFTIGFYLFNFHQKKKSRNAKYGDQNLQFFESYTIYNFYTY